MDLLSDCSIEQFEDVLIKNIKSKSTIEKYMYFVKNFKLWIENRKIDKEVYEEYISHLKETYAISSVNMAISALNSFWQCCNMPELKIRQIKPYKRLKTNLLSKEEYLKLIKAAKMINEKRLLLLMKVFCATGIRVSEIKHITINALNTGEFETSFRGVRKVISFPEDLRTQLLDFAHENNIINGCVFVTKNGNPLDRSRICKELKDLSYYTDVPREKICPDNIRFLPTHHITEKDMRTMIY